MQQWTGLKDSLETIAQRCLQLKQSTVRTELREEVNGVKWKWSKIHIYTHRLPFHRPHTHAHTDETRKPQNSISVRMLNIQPKKQTEANNK